METVCFSKRRHRPTHQHDAKIPKNLKKLVFKWIYRILECRDAMRKQYIYIYIYIYAEITVRNIKLSTAIVVTMFGRHFEYNGHCGKSFP
jgi:hypothetical protein